MDTSLKVINEKPPNFWDIAVVFPDVLVKKGILYCYGTTLFNPDNIEIPKQLWDHEKVHSIHQDGQPFEWWKQYLDDVQFRFQQELAAHRREWQIYKKLTKDRNDLARYLHSCATRLAGPLYGNCVDFKTAFKLIKEN